MAQVIKKFIGSNQVGAGTIRLENNTYLRGRNDIVSLKYQY